MITLLWPDGAITTGATYREVEDAIRAEQWSPYGTRFTFRRAMAKRAGIWSATRVGVLGSSRRFINSLADAEMFMIVEAGDEPGEE